MEYQKQRKKKSPAQRSVHSRVEKYESMLRGSNYASRYQAESEFEN